MKRRSVAISLTVALLFSAIPLMASVKPVEASVTGQLWSSRTTSTGSMQLRA